MLRHGARTRYVVAAFSVELRDETNLAALSNDFVGVTMQPTYVSLWLSPKASPKGEHAQHAWHAPV